MDQAKLKAYQQFYHDQILNDCVPFWMNSDLLDREYGGYISSVDEEGRCYNSDKSVWFQGRGLWTFSALCNRYGVRDEWIEAAKLGKTFLEEHCVDSDGRMFFQTTREGLPLRKRRYMYSESFYVVGMAEYAAATGDKDALAKAEAMFEQMLMLYRTPEKDPFKITPKGYATTRATRESAVPMVLVSSAQLLRRCDPDKADYYTAVADEMAAAILDYHYKPELECVLESVLLDGTRYDTPAGRTVNPGHSCENSWFLMNQALVTGNKELLEKALNVLNWSLKLGWDEEHGGGMVYFVDIDGRPCEQLEWDMKLWWVHNEVLIATLMAYGLTGEQQYFDWFEKTHAYAFSHFHDEKNGEWYGYLHRDGTVSHTQKGSMWKGPYHLPRCLMLCDKMLSELAEGKPITPIL
ncbi:MAG: AGE family epimerase/isomerase [Clostridia bacterium]|nr:AGE family epimerase/isomerase [Clostridia bacterium]